MPRTGDTASLVAGNSRQRPSLTAVMEVEGIRTVYMKLPDQFGAGSAKKALIQMSIPLRLKSILKDGFRKDRPSTS